MNEDYKKRVNERYSQSLQKGERFWPDSIYRDLVFAFCLFILLILLATFVGVPGEPKADPSDVSYVPRPEWYFLFLFEFLKVYGKLPIIGRIEWIAALVIPGILILILFLLPLIDKNPSRYYSKRKFGLAAMGSIVVGMVALTIMAVVSTPPQPGVEVAGTISEQIVLGQDLYSIQCVECHGADGEGGEIIGVEGLEGVVAKAINSQDEMYTRNDTSLFDIISFGQSSLGMQPFGRAYGGELSPSDIEYIVTFMRYTWDDRAELPQEAAAAVAIPALGPDEVPSYVVHIQPLVKRFCVSCHRAGKTNNNYLMTTYEEILTTGDNLENSIIPGDMNSYFIVVLNGTEILDPVTGEVLIHQMPPTKLIKPEYIDTLTRWIMAGMPNTAEEAQALGPTPTPTSIP